MPPRRHRLTHKPRSCKLLLIQLLRDLARGEAVASGGEGLDDAFGGEVVGLGEEGGGVEEGFGGTDLGVEGFGEEEGYAVDCDGLLDANRWY